MLLAMNPRRHCLAWVVAWAVAAVLGGCVSDAAPARPLQAGPRQAVAALPAPDVPERGWTCTVACSRWSPVLDRLDVHRARAYATGRPHPLHRVYVRGSRVLAHDRRMLRAWIRRDATVTGVRLRVLHVRRLPTKGADVRLRVVDQLTHGAATLPGGNRMPLPRDRPTAHVVVLRRTTVGWRIAAIR